MADFDNIQDLISKIEKERLELYKKQGYTNGKSVAKVDNHTKSIVKPVQKKEEVKPKKTESKPVKVVKAEKPKTEKVKKTEDKPIKVVKVKKPEEKKPEVKKEEKKVEKPVKAKIVKEKKPKTRKKLKISKKAIPIFVVIALSGFLVYKSGLIQNAITKLTTTKYVKENPGVTDETLIEHDYSDIEQPSIEEPIEEPEYIEYISGELLDSGYDFNKDITPSYLKSLNPTLSETTAWIEIPGTKINYPFVFPSVDNINKVEGLRDSISTSVYDDYEYMNMYYLKHTMNDTKSDWGTLYQDVYTEPLNQHSNELSDMSVIYGHHMMDGSMFTGLDRWKKDSDGKYGNEHPFGVIYTDDGLCYKLTFITSRVVSGDDYTNINPGNFNSVEDKQAFIDEVIAQAKKDGNFTLDEYIVDEDTKFMSLVTCSYRQQNDRYVLIGVLEKQAIKDINIDGYEIGKKKER